MKFAQELMTSKTVQHGKIGDAVRSGRNQWAESMEHLIRSKSPYPCSYDVSQTQDTRFSEYTYTELLGGVWVATQSVEINARIMSLESSRKSQVKLSQIQDSITDKYESDGGEHKHSGAKKVVFMPGHNMMDCASVEMIHRLVHEDPEVVIKPHPITNDESLKFLGTRFGWDKIASREVSGNKMMAEADVVYTTSASEFSLSATALGKEVVNISNFFNEAVGAYYPISRVLFMAHKESVAKAQEVLCNLLSGQAGIIMPFVEDVESTLTNYYQYSLDIKGMYQDFRDKSQKNPAKPTKVENHG